MPKLRTPISIIETKDLSPKKALERICRREADAHPTSREIRTIACMGTETTRYDRRIGSRNSSSTNCRYRRHHLLGEALWHLRISFV